MVTSATEENALTELAAEKSAIEMAAAANRKLAAVFWDMDGTLIDSEPYWHESEIQIAKKHGGEWSEELAWQYSGGSLKDVAEAMIARGTKMGVEEIGNAMVDYVAERESVEVPWVPDVLDLLQKLADAKIPSILVSNSPRRLVENIVNHAPKGAFAGFVCGDDGYATKPSPEPYLAAGRLLGISAQNMKYCIAIEDSFAGLKSAAASGATTLAQRAYSNLDVSGGPQFADLDGYKDLTPQALERYIIDRIAQ